MSDLVSGGVSTERAAALERAELALDENRRTADEADFATGYGAEQPEEAFQYAGESLSDCWEERDALARDVLSLVERLETAERERDEAIVRGDQWKDDAIAAERALDHVEDGLLASRREARSRATAAESRVERLEEALREIDAKVTSVLLHPEEEGKPQ